MAAPKKPQKPKKAHPFAAMPEFEQGMKKIVQTPKEVVERLEAESRTPRRKEK